MTLQQQIRANRRRTAYVILAFAALIVVFAAASAAFVGRSGAIGLLAFGLAYGVFAWWNAGRLIGGLTHATPLQKSDDPELYRLIENVSIAAGLTATPPIYLVDDPAPNAFAAGSRPSSIYVGVTSGLRKLMPARELEAVLAHEISHIRNKDVRLMTLAAVLVGVIAIISDFAFRMAFFGGRGGRDRNPIQLIAAIVALVLAPDRRRDAAAGAEPAARVPRRRERGRDPQRPRGDGARAPPPAARHERGRLRRSRHRAPLHREPHPLRDGAGRLPRRASSRRIRRSRTGSRRSRRQAASGSTRSPAAA